MCKNRLRVVSPSKHRSSPPRVYMDPNARGAAYHIHTIYIRRYGHRPTTLILWILDLHRLTGAKSHQPPKPQTRRLTKATDPRVPGSHGSQVTESHRPPNYGLTKSHPHTHMCWINLAYLRLPFGSPLGA